MKRRKCLIFFSAWLMLAMGCNQGPWNSGDRVLVSKFLYDTEVSKPQRYDVVVFKYPVRPIEKGVPKNYIKRLMGLPGQLIAILFGRLFFLDPEGEAPLFPEPQDLNLKDGRAYKGFVVQEDDAKVTFQIFDYKRKVGERFYEETISRSDIASISPIPEEEALEASFARRLPAQRRAFRGK